MKLSYWLQRLVLCVVLGSGFALSAETPTTVNINTADAEMLATVLTGVGRVRAQSIVKWRETHGPFTTAEQLAEVKGVGATVLEKNRSRIVLE